MKVLTEHGNKFRMNGNGRCTDNVFIERLWCSLKYEEVYLNAYDAIPEAREGIRKWIDFYNQRRKHQGLDRRTPNDVCYTNMNAQAPVGDCA